MLPQATTVPRSARPAAASSRPGARAWWALPGGVLRRCPLPFLPLPFLLAFALLLTGPLPHPAAAQVGRLDLLGQYGGAVMAVASSRGLVLVGMGPRMLVMTGCDPLYLEEVGRSEVLPGLVQDILIDGTHAWVAVSQAGVLEMDLTDPARPRTLRRIELPGVSAKVVRQGRLLYVVAGAAGLHIVDLEAEGGARRVGHVAEIVTDVSVSNGHAYTVNRNLVAVDVSDPANPRGKRLLEDWADAVISEGPIVFASASVSAGGTERSSTLHIHDHTNVRRPVLVGSLPIGDQAVFMSLVGKRLYHQGLRQLTVIDVSELGRPRILAQIPTVDSVWRVAVDGPWAWMAAGSFGFQVADLARGGARTVLPTLSNARRVVAEGHIAVVEEGTNLGGPTGHLEVLDISVPAWPRYLGRIEQTVDKSGILLRQGILYLGVPGETLKVYDLRQPARGPYAELASLKLPNDPVGGRKAPVWRLAAEGDLLYMANDEWVRVFDIVDPAGIREVSRIRSSGGATDIAVAGQRAYVLGPATGVNTGRPSLQVYDFFKLDDPVAFGVVGSLGFREGIAVRGTRVYAAGPGGLNVPGGFQIFEVTAPDKPVEVARLPLSGRTGDFVLQDGLERALLARSDNSGGGELLDLDLSNPQTPRAVASQTLADEGRDIALSGGLAIVAAETAGILLYQVAPGLPQAPTATPPATPHPPLPFAAYLPALGRGGLSKCP